MMNPMRTLLVGSSGGHLAQLHQLKPWWERHDRKWVTFEKPDAISLLAGEDTEWAYQPTTRNIPNLLRNLGSPGRCCAATGPTWSSPPAPACAFPFFVMAKALRMKTVYVEVYDRIDSKPLTSKLCYPFSDLFLVQWDEQQKLYPKSQVIGRLF